MKLPSGFRPERVVVIRPRGLGDIVLASAVLDALARAYPGARLDFVAEKAARGLLETDERLGRIFLLCRGERVGSGRVQIGFTRAAIRWLRAGRYDLVVDLFSNPHTAILTAFSGARWRVGLAKRLRSVAYNVRVPRTVGNESGERRYAVEWLLDFLRGAGVTWEGRARPGLALTGEDRERAGQILADRGYGARPFAAVLPGGTWESKRWTVEGYAAVAGALADRLGAPTLVLWGPPEREAAAAIAERVGEGAVLAPPTSLREMAALLARPALVVCADCLGRHFAVVQGTPTVGIFGGTHAREWTPSEGPHRTVEAAKAGVATLRELSFEPVLAEALKLLPAASSR